VGSHGTHNALGLAKWKRARFLISSTSEVYGDPQVHPQPETYWGNVNPIGPRGVYDEAKRYAEALTMAYHNQQGVNTAIARIFNSILADEQVLVDDGRELRRERVADLAARSAGRAVAAGFVPALMPGSLAPASASFSPAVEYPLNGFTVPAFDANGHSLPARATALIAHPTDEACFEIRTRYGRSIRTTGHHSVFVEGESGEPEPRAVAELELGDRIAIARRIHVPERDRREEPADPLPSRPPSRRPALAYLRSGSPTRVAPLLSTTKTVATYKALRQVARMDLYWGGLSASREDEAAHPSNPLDVAYDWTTYDRVVEQLHAAGIKVLFSIYGTPEWSNGGAGLNVAPQNAADLQKFAYAAALRYSGRFVAGGVKLPAVREWLAWNEPNNPVFLRPQYQRVGSRWVIASAKSYAKICNAVYRGVHAAGVGAERVACGGTAPRQQQPAAEQPPFRLAARVPQRREGRRPRHFRRLGSPPVLLESIRAPASAVTGGSVELGNIGTLTGS
jgi:hypothetical protein